MAFDAGLAHRVRELIAGRRGVSERRMFGGLALLVDGKMFVGILGSTLMARVGLQHYEDALALPHVRAMDFTGRPMRGYVFVDEPGLESDRDLEAWVLWCLNHADALPIRPVRKRRG